MNLADAGGGRQAFLGGYLRAGVQLVTLDLDGTLIETTVFQAAGEHLGMDEEIAFFDDLYFRGIISLETTFMAEYELFLDRPVDEVQDALEEGPWLPDIQETVQALRAHGLQVWVVTDQPDWAVEVLASEGLSEGVYSTTRRWGGKIGPVDEMVFEKAPALIRRLDHAGIPAEEVCHVGNGSNDVPVFAEVGRSIAFNPDDEHIADAADVSMEADRLDGILEPIRSWR